MNNVEPVLHKKPFHELTTDELYELLRVRSEVFVVEQNCVYQDMDGDDQKSIHLWLMTQPLLIIGTYDKEVKPESSGLRSLQCHA
jgi:predicted GNAT family N-acyltransferase